MTAPRLHARWRLSSTGDRPDEIRPDRCVARSGHASTDAACRDWHRTRVDTVHRRPTDHSWPAASAIRRPPRGPRHRAGCDLPSRSRWAPVEAADSPRHGWPQAGSARVRTWLDRRSTRVRAKHTPAYGFPASGCTRRSGSSHATSEHGPAQRSDRSPIVGRISAQPPCSSLTTPSSTGTRVPGAPGSVSERTVAT